MNTRTHPEHRHSVVHIRVLPLHITGSQNCGQTLCTARADVRHLCAAWEGPCPACQHVADMRTGGVHAECSGACKQMMVTTGGAMLTALAAVLSSQQWQLWLHGAKTGQCKAGRRGYGCT